mgnify:CR=1 FL=1
MLSIEYRYFFQSALDSSIRKASQNLNINSSAIVRQIQKLEDELGVQIFNRTKKPVTLTKVGEEILKQAKSIISESKRMDGKEHKCNEKPAKKIRFVY